MRSRLALSLALAFLAGCSDSTGPEERIEVHLGHAAPGLGQVAASLGSADFGPLLPLGDRMLEVKPGSYTLDVELAEGTLASTLDVQAGRAYAAVLMDADAPTLRVYEAPLGDLQRFTLINAVPGGGGLTVSLSTGGGLARIDLSHGEAGVVDVGASTFQLTVAPAGGGDPVTLPTPTFGFDQVFLVIAPGGEPGREYALLVL